MSRAVRRFELDGLEQFRGGGGSVWMKIIPGSGNMGIGTIDSRLKATMTRQLVREMTQERIINDPDMREAVGALSLVSNGLYIQEAKMLDQVHMVLLLTNRLGAETVDVDVLDKSTEIAHNSLVGQLDNRFPAPAGNWVFNAEHWTQWIADIRGNVHVAVNEPQAAPAVANVPANEIHPWMFGGYINVNLTDGQAFAVPVVDNGESALISILQILVAVSSRGGAIRVSGMTHLALGVCIVSSGGNITNARLRRIVASVARETLTENIDITREMVQKGWDFLSIYWEQAAGVIGQDFQNMFNALGETGRRSSLRLALLCTQTEFKMLTGIVTTLRAINGFIDFSWDELNAAIIGTTGRDEMAVVADYAEFINPPAPGPLGPLPVGGHWAGWLFSLERRAANRMTIANYPNLLYAATQLDIQVGGNLSMRQYQGLDNHVVAAKPLIDAWIGQYITAKAQQNQNFALVAAGAQVVGHLQRVRVHRI